MVAALFNIFYFVRSDELLFVASKRKRAEPSFWSGRVLGACIAPFELFYGSDAGYSFCMVACRAPGLNAGMQSAGNWFGLFRSGRGEPLNRYGVGSILRYYFDDATRTSITDCSPDLFMVRYY